jgi:fermentation-respiration switch protein FrsA (DUF1100 family)
MRLKVESRSSWVDAYNAAVVHEHADPGVHRRNFPRPVLFIHGEKAHSRYFGETAYAAAAQPKELMIIPGASHTDLYDRVDLNPLTS